MGIYGDENHRLSFGDENRFKKVSAEDDENLFDDVEEYDLDAHIKYHFGDEGESLNESES
jgi:hypothetical protein